MAAANAFTAFPLRQQPGSDALDAKKAEFRADLAVRLTCPNCPPDLPPNIVESYSDGDLVCGNCGLVLGDRVIDERSEWRTFANEDGDDPSRVGAGSNSLIDGPDDFSTVVSFKDGHTGISKGLQQAARTVQAKAGAPGLGDAFQEIGAMCELMSLPRQVGDTAKQLYMRATQDEKVLRGRALAANVAACIFIGCRQARVPRTFKEIVALTGVDKKQFVAAFKLLRQTFDGTGPVGLASGARKGDAGDGSLGAPQALTADQIAASAEDIVMRFCSNLALPHYLQVAACEVAKRVTNLGLLTGRSPITVATSCIYFTSHLMKHGKSTAEIATVGGIADSTVRFAYKLILPRAAELIDDAWVAKGRADLENLPK